MGNAHDIWLFKDIEMAILLLEEVYKMYGQIGIGKTHPNCLDCQKKAKEKSKTIIGPVPIYHVGNKFTEDKFKILFIGAVAYGFDDVIVKDWKDVYIGDPRYFGTCIKEMHETTKCLFRAFPSNFLKVIKGVCKKLYGDENEGFERIAISNIIKCNLGDVEDNIPSKMRCLCANKGAKLEVAKREIEIISPKFIISLAGSKYNDYLKDWDHNKYRIMSHLHHPSVRGTKIDEYVDKLYCWVLNIS